MKNLHNEKNVWFEFYRSRIGCERYDKHFRHKYYEFLKLILDHSNGRIIEAGCGIGSVSKALMREGIKCSGFDLSSLMVAAANTNVGQELFTQGDMFSLSSTEFVVTHGVLEHYSDEQIVDFLVNNPIGCHYVPTNSYDTPSFGDERLLPFNHWYELLDKVLDKTFDTWGKHTNYRFELFNNGKDLAFVSILK